MDNVFLTTRNSYIDKGLHTVPLEGKRPFINDWVNVNFDEMFSSRLINKNIGLKTGKHSGVICIDIDIEDPIKRKQITDLLPPLYAGKVGNKDRGANYFFKYNGEESRKFGPVEILSTGNQTVVPPSIHPEKNYAYEWAGESLLHIDIDNLPLLPNSFIEELSILYGCKNASLTLVPSQGRCAHGSHNKLSEMLIAKILEHYTPDQIVNELIEYDSKINPDLSYFLCPSRKWRVQDIGLNAYAFVLEGLKSKLIKGEIKKVSLVPANSIQILDTPPKRQIILPETDYKKHKLPKLRGIAQEMFQYIYDNAPIPRSQFAFASSISAMSTLLGNKIQYQGTLPNLYTMILGNSGSGKDFPLKFPINLLTDSKLKHFIGEGAPASDTSIIQNLGDQPIRIDVIDEASFLFGSMQQKESYLKNMANTYQALYTSTGKYFQGKTAYKFKTKDNPLGRLGECQNPYVNILCGMTVDDFRNSFNDNLMEKGLGGRFLYFVDEEPKKNEFRDVQSIPNELLEYANKIQAKKEGLYSFSNGIMSIKSDVRSKSVIRGALQALDQLKLDADSSSRIKPILNRLPQLMLKMAIIDACSVQHDTEIENVVLRADSVNWAMSFIGAYLKNMTNFIQLNMSSGYKTRILDTMESVIAENNGKISLTQFSRNYRIRKLELLSNEKNAYFQTLIDNGIIKVSVEGNAKLLTLI